MGLDRPDRAIEERVQHGDGVGGGPAVGDAGEPAQIASPDDGADGFPRAPGDGAVEDAPARVPPEIGAEQRGGHPARDPELDRHGEERQHVVKQPLLIRGGAAGPVGREGDRGAA